jgi:hypothetical protein
MTPHLATLSAQSRKKLAIDWEGATYIRASALSQAIHQPEALAALCASRGCSHVYEAPRLAAHGKVKRVVDCPDSQNRAKQKWMKGVCETKSIEAARCDV